MAQGEEVGPNLGGTRGWLQTTIMSDNRGSRDEKRQHHTTTGKRYKGLRAQQVAEILGWDRTRAAPGNKKKEETKLPTLSLSLSLPFSLLLCPVCALAIAAEIDEFRPGWIWIDFSMLQKL